MITGGEKTHAYVNILMKTEMFAFIFMLLGYTRRQSISDNQRERGELISPGVIVTRSTDGPSFVLICFARSVLVTVDCAYDALDHVMT